MFNGLYSLHYINLFPTSNNKQIVLNFSLKTRKNSGFILCLKVCINYKVNEKINAKIRYFKLISFNFNLLDF